MLRHACPGAVRGRGGGRRGDVLRAVRLPDHRGAGRRARPDGSGRPPALLPTPARVRLVPALLVLVAGVVARDPGARPAAATGTSSARPCLVALTWTGNLPFGHASDATFHLWTLATEEQFYLVWPAVLALALRARPGRRRRSSPAPPPCLLACVATAGWLAEAPDLAYVAADVAGRSASSIGAAVRLHRTGCRPCRRYAVAVALAGLAVLSVVPLRGHALTYLAGGPAIAALTAAAAARRGVTWTDVDRAPRPARRGLARHGLLRGVPLELPADALAAAVRRPRRAARRRADARRRRAELAVRRGAAAARSRRPVRSRWRHERATARLDTPTSPSGFGVLVCRPGRGDARGDGRQRLADDGRARRRRWPSRIGTGAEASRRWRWRWCGLIGGCCSWSPRPRCCSSSWPSVSVAFGTARWGAVGTVVASGLSIPAGTADRAVRARPSFDYGGRSLVRARPSPASSTVYAHRRHAGRSVSRSSAWPSSALPWLAGLALRFAARAQDSRASQVVAEEQAAQAVRQADQAREIARLREEQARLARDVHDVVGHSLAVILAQAESAQYLRRRHPRSSSRRWRTSPAPRAPRSRTCARCWLPSEHPPQAPRAPRDPGRRCPGQRARGRARARSAPPSRCRPSLEVVAYRVLQEMLTNAVKHGRRDEPVFVERHWPDGAFAGELRLEVRNAVGAARDPGRGDRSGGCRRPRPRRHAAPAVEAAGGRLDVRLRESPGGHSFTAYGVGAGAPAARWPDDDPGAPGRRPGPVPRGRARDRRRAGRAWSVVGYAGDGLEAVRLVDELEPDVVLMDIRMPEMDGVEATRQIFSPERVAHRAPQVRRCGWSC